MQEQIRENQQSIIRKERAKHSRVICRSEDQVILIDPESGVLYETKLFGKSDTLETTAYERLPLFMESHELTHAATAYAGMTRSNYQDYQFFYDKYLFDPYWRNITPSWNDSALAQSLRIHTNYGAELWFHQISGMWFAEVIWYRNGRWMFRLEDDFFLRKDADKTIAAILALTAQRAKTRRNA